MSPKRIRREWRAYRRERDTVWQTRFCRQAGLDAVSRGVARTTNTVRDSRHCATAPPVE